MLSYLKSFLRPLVSPTSGVSTQAGHLLHPFSHEELDQYPFPANPGSVRKARHDNTPNVLPPHNASVRDVRYFLYTLLTSKTNKCAKKYPEWVLETCIAWHGDGEVLRACDEQDLLTLCPYIAVAEGIKSTKHRPGAYVPIPARHMIGEVIARFVMDRKTRETGSSNIQRRLQAERTRSVSSLGFRATPDSRPFGHLPDLGTSGSPQLARRRSVQSLDANSGMNQVIPTPAMWMASKTIYDVSSTIGRSGTPASEFREPPNMAAPVPLAPIRVPSSAGSTDSMSPRESASSHPSSSTYMTSLASSPSNDFSRGNLLSIDDAKSTSFSDTTRSMSRSPDASHVQPRQSTSHSTMNPYAGPVQFHELGDVRPNGRGPAHTNPPQRYAHRRPSGLRQSPILSNSRHNAPPQSSQGYVDNAMETTSRNSHLPGRQPMPPRRRRSSLASLSRLSIPERINEELQEMPSSPASMNQQFWSDNIVNNDRMRLQGTVPQVRRPSMRKVHSQHVLDSHRSSTPPLQRGVYHPSRTPSEEVLDTKSPVTLIEVIENKQRRARKPSRGDLRGTEWGG